MSTFAYAKLTNLRDEATPGTSTTKETPGVGKYVDSLAALVPAEVLSLHAVILTFTMETVDKTTVRMIAPDGKPTLFWSFWACVALAAVIYLVGRGKKVDQYDWIRAAIPPVAFVAWTMLQRATAFDAVGPDLHAIPRMAIGIFVAVILSLVTAALAQKADEKPPTAA